MAEERQVSREMDYRKVPSWTQILRTFLVALDPFKLLIAAFGILATAIGWWLISLVIWSMWSKPKEEDFKPAPDAKEQEQSAELKSQQEAAFKRYEFMKEMAGEGGRYRIMPWFEDRGPNPWTLVKTVVAGKPGERGKEVQWFYTNQAPNLIEPLRKFLSPIISLFDSKGNIWTKFYLFLILLWFLIVWAFVGGVITRMALLQLAGKEGGGLRDSVKFVSNRYMSYLFSPLVPIALILAIVFCCILFGLVRMIPVVGDILIDGLLWFLPLAAGFVMALLIVGLVGYPLMYSTLSAEGSDTFDALSRSYNYVYESPWTYIWYSFIAILYGAVLIFFVVFISSLMIYLAKWGVSQTPLMETFDRTVEHLYMYSPTSFGWREVLLSGTPIDVDQHGNDLLPTMANAYREKLHWWSYVGASMVGFWLTLVFLMMLGFGYSYFWTAASMIYLLMRKKVDETEMDEVYIEEEEFQEPIAPIKPSANNPPVPSGTQMVDAPSLRVAPSTTASPTSEKAPEKPPEKPPEKAPEKPVEKPADKAMSETPAPTPSSPPPPATPPSPPTSATPPTPPASPTPPPPKPPEEGAK